MKTYKHTVTISKHRVSISNSKVSISEHMVSISKHKVPIPKHTVSISKHTVSISKQEGKGEGQPSAAHPSQPTHIKSKQTEPISDPGRVSVEEPPAKSL